jgi:hypothetical protein
MTSMINTNVFFDFTDFQESPRYDVGGGHFQYHTLNRQARITLNVECYPCLFFYFILMFEDKDPD